MFTRQLQFLKQIMELRPTVDNLSENSGSQTPSVEVAERPQTSTMVEDQPLVMEQPEDTEEASCSQLLSTAEQTSENVEVPEIPPSNEAAEEPVCRSSGRRARRVNTDSGVDLRQQVDMMVMEYLNRNRSDGKEEITLKGLAPCFRRVLEERQTRCVSAIAMLMDLFSGPQEPHHLMDYIMNDRNAMLQVNPDSSHRPDPPMVHPPGPFMRDLYDL
ncbi:uncharacterized protein LOC122928737 [Bufo gargarizans]|uniref:uncharacterized protein LOC122928737 n=1 Tax=Bufo gargarizans TaxID=30331 RepID=UPI001CF29E08|nr:uncharacterized protein LOC122928737 [Bufo gargarizans]